MGTVLGIKEGSPSASHGLRQRDRIFIPEKTFSISYIVLADSENEDEEQILDSAFLPRLFSYYAGTWCKKLSAKEERTIFRHPDTGVRTTLWTVKADYDNNFDPSEDAEEPTQRTPVVRWSGESEDEVMEEDPITGEPIQTKADEPILLTRPAVHPILEISRYEGYPFDPDTMLAYSHTTNSTTFWGAAVGSALMMPMTVDEEIIDGTKFCRVTYRIKFRIRYEAGSMAEDTWKARILHHGFKYRERAGSDPVIFQDKHGNPTTVNLKNLDGTRVPNGDPAEYLEFNRYFKTNFNALSLGPF